MPAKNAEKFQKKLEKNNTLRKFIIFSRCFPREKCPALTMTLFFFSFFNGFEASKCNFVSGKNVYFFLIFKTIEIAKTIQTFYSLVLESYASDRPRKDNPKPRNAIYYLQELKYLDFFQNQVPKILWHPHIFWAIWAALTWAFVACFSWNILSILESGFC